MGSVVARHRCSIISKAATVQAWERAKKKNETSRARDSLPRILALSLPNPFNLAIRRGLTFSLHGPPFNCSTMIAGFKRVVLSQPVAQRGRVTLHVAQVTRDIARYI